MRVLSAPFDEVLHAFLEARASELKIKLGEEMPSTSSEAEDVVSPKHEVV